MEREAVTPTPKTQRVLATIVFTDGVNFSARMSEDEERALTLIHRDLQFMQDCCRQYKGKVLKSTGDSLLMCFSSATKAVDCAIKIQKTFAKNVTQFPERERLYHRIGIHLGDVFISNTDVMGNSVNIAARLQTEAQPGGICLSQTVYDVVKSHLEIEATYLGKRELKNIQEIVSVYHIAPIRQDNTGDLTGAATIAFDANSLDLYTAIAQNLQQDANHIRIKKIIYCACRNRWPSDSKTLDSLEFPDLIRELYEKTQTLTYLENVLTEIVRNVNKPDEYALIARIILNKVGRMYPDYHQQHSGTGSGRNATIFTGRGHAASATDSSVSIEPKGYPSPTHPELAPLWIQPSSASAVAVAPPEDPPKKAAQSFEQHQNTGRIKKLLFCVTRGYWENDPATLDLCSFPDLIQDLREILPTPPQLQTSLEGVVGTLNHSATYRPLVPAILRIMEPLYANDLSPTVVDTSREKTEAFIENLEVLNHPPEVQAEGSPSLPFIMVDRFDVRQVIMNQTSPLRAKILIFSIVKHKFSFTDQDWSALKEFGLDELLRELFYSCNTHAELCDRLSIASSVLDDSDEQNQQSASVISEAIKPLYSYLEAGVERSALFD